MRLLTLAVILNLCAFLGHATAMAAPVVCTIGLAHDPFFQLVVEAHKQQILSLEDIQQLAVEKVPVDPTRFALEAYNTTAIKQGFRNLLTSERTEKIWPETVRRLEEYIVKAGSNNEKREEAKHVTRNVIAPRLLQDFPSSSLSPALIEVGKGKVLIAHYTSDKKIQVRVLGDNSGGMLFSSDLPPEASGILAVAWHRSASGALSLYSAVNLEKAIQDGPERIEIQEWDWATQKLKRPVIKMTLGAIVNGLSWVNVPTGGMTLKIQGRFSPTFYDVLQAKPKELSDWKPLGVTKSHITSGGLQIPDGLQFTAFSIAAEVRNFISTRPDNEVFSALKLRDGRIAIVAGTGTHPLNFQLFGQTRIQRDLPFPNKLIGEVQTFETLDGRLLIAAASWDDENHSDFRVHVFEPALSSTPIASLPFNFTGGNLQMKWFSDPHGLPFLAVSNGRGTSAQIMDPLGQRTESSFAVPTYAKWFAIGREIFFWNLESGHMRIYQVYSPLGEDKP